MEAVDDAVMSDGTGAIISLTFEKLVRLAYGLGRAFEGVHKETGWKRPSVTKDLTSRVELDLCDCCDVRG